MLNTGRGRNRKRLGRKLGNQEIQVRNSFGFSGADGRLHENKSERGEINRVSLINALVLIEPINCRMVNSEAPQTAFEEVTGHVLEPDFGPVSPDSHL